MGTTSRLPQLQSYHYWMNKTHFQLAADTYDSWVMFVMENGAFHYRIGPYAGKAEAGDLVLCPPHQTFEREAIEAVTFHFIRFDYPADPAVPCGRIRLSRQSRTADNCTELRAIARENSDFADNIRSHTLHDLWLLILKEFVRPRGPEMMHPAADPVVQEIKEFLHEHALQPLQVKEAAARFHLTSVQLTRRFQKAFHQRPIDFLTNLRMQHACSLLVTTDMTIDAIALSCGYETGFYLSRVFAKQMGISPSAYRQRNRV